VTIRPARAQDAAALVPLFEDWSHPLPAAAIEERIATWEATPRAALLVAELDGDVAGVVAVNATPHLARRDSFARLVGLVVSSAHRRRGIGEALVRAAEARARGWGCHRLELTSTRTRSEAPAFYTALGYVDLSERQAHTAASSEVRPGALTRWPGRCGRRRARRRPGSPRRGTPRRTRRRPR
jgi:GNAT superfamily N-acetyltransferase